ncbi:MAG: cbb3-type cytochrome oxidase assembly protein [Desulfovibrionaceae bacterium]
MTSGMWMLLGWSAFVILTGLVFLAWGWRRGQFKNVEEAKYRMLEDREPEPWPDKQGENHHG